MYVYIYLVSFSIYHWSLTCNQIVALHPLSFVLCCNCLSLRGDHCDISCQCPLKLKILLVIQQQHDWDDDETLLIICDYFEDVNWRWLYLRQVLRWDQRTSWRGLTSSFPLRLGVVPCRWLPAFKRWVQSVANETAVIGRRGRERIHEKEGRMMIIPSTLVQLIWYQSRTHMSLFSVSSSLLWWPCSPLLVHPSLPSLFV